MVYIVSLLSYGACSSVLGDKWRTFLVEMNICCHHVFLVLFPCKELSCLGCSRNVNIVKTSSSDFLRQGLSKLSYRWHATPWSRWFSFANFWSCFLILLNCEAIILLELNQRVGRNSKYEIPLLKKKSTQAGLITGVTDVTCLTHNSTFSYFINCSYWKKIFFIIIKPTEGIHQFALCLFSLYFYWWSSIFIWRYVSWLCLVVLGIKWLKGDIFSHRKPRIRNFITWLRLRPISQGLKAFHQHACRRPNNLILVCTHILCVYLA